MEEKTVFYIIESILLMNKLNYWRKKENKASWVYERKLVKSLKALKGPKSAFYKMILRLLAFHLMFVVTT